MSPAKVYKIANVMLRLVIIGATIWYLYEQLFAREKLDVLVEDIRDWRDFEPVMAFWIAALLLMPVNLWLETLKWRFLVDKLEKLKLNKAFTAVLSGISVSMFMPNRVGDYLGRVFILEKGNPVKGVLITMIGSLAQLLVTMLMGGLALLFYLPKVTLFAEPLPDLFFAGIVVLVFVLLVAGVLLFFNINLVYVITKKLFPKKGPVLLPYVEVFNYYNHKQLAVVLGLSVLRYLVFSFQFILFLWAFKLSIVYIDAFILVALSYLLITLIPTVALSELGVRGSVSVYLFSAWYAAQQLDTIGLNTSVFAASTAVWVVNIAFPALLGVFFVYRLKFFRRQNGKR
ncbi:MAG: flippase-like domain-containing protein [Bacteroidetes bacterium]|nr:flippase-like domain-containing protein [Bacteroidota bacterium]MBU1579162.1 flippase-like domain-containing protein [Bacteroidota bacterium]MBU2464757.1 flippase-like domain-containing protein [Bacteroidota bacterium]MBU2558674.1 flippase-like domain-containing protein [Bacteroidota bacterium]